MTVHRPYLSILTGCCMLGVICFYVMVCWQNHSNAPSAAEIKIRKAARTRKRKEELAKREAEATRKRIEAKELSVANSRDAMVLRKRNKSDDTINPTESEGSYTQSSSEYNSQTET